MRAPDSIRFLVTAGPTREFLDPVRFLSNRSSGKMGYALATAARAVSSHVVLVSGPTALAAPAGVELVAVTTAQEMADAVGGRFDDCDVVLMAAAVADFRPKQATVQKLKKRIWNGMLELEPTPDILAELGRQRRGQVLVGFALETENLEANAQLKLRGKGLDLIVANTPSAFDSETNHVVLIGRDGRREQWPEMSKREVAAAIVARAVALVA